MGKPNVSRQALVEAIATLEAQRGLTGAGPDLDRAVDTALAALHRKLEQIQIEPGNRQRRQLTVLVADLSGFTALSENMDAEWVSDAINSMWHVLDAVIRAWGGRIDQHAGDSLMAVFGYPNPRQEDTARALHAALAMQQELDLFNERVRRAADESFDATWAGKWPSPSMRIGVHSGIVYYARAFGEAAPQGDRMTALGETVAEARRMERLAHAGGILVSAVAARQAHNRFVFKSLTSDGNPGLEVENAYLVKSERPAVMDDQPGTVAGQVTRLVGRAEQLDRLEMVLQAAIDNRMPQLVTIVGPSGVGKTRLVYEFLGRARLLAGSTPILRAGTQGAHRAYPFALVRDLLLRQFNLYPQDSRYLIEHKLRQGLAGFEETARSGGPLEGVNAADRAIALLEQLIDVKTAARLSVDDVLGGVSLLLRAISTSGPAIVILEGISRADEPSLELIHRLAHEPEIGPILFIAVATEADTVDPAVPLPWLGYEDNALSPFMRIDVPPLTSVESRLMAAQILNPLSPASMRMAELVVAGAMGNPLYIESYIQLLIERGILVTGGRWRVDLVRAEAMTLQPGLSRLIEARLSHLPDVERFVLRRAAVSGPLCWDDALLEAKSAADFAAPEIETALLSLEMKRYLIRDEVYSFAATQAYAFRRDTVRETVYRSVPEGERRTSHLEAAHWLVANEYDDRFSAWFPIDAMIARNFAAAGDYERADAWHRRGRLAEIEP